MLQGQVEGEPEPVKGKPVFPLRMEKQKFPFWTWHRAFFQPWHSVLLAGLWVRRQDCTSLQAEVGCRLDSSRTSLASGRILARSGSPAWWFFHFFPAFCDGAFNFHPDGHRDGQRCWHMTQVEHLLLYFNCILSCSFLSYCTDHFSHRCNKYRTKNSIQKGGFILAHIWGSSPSWRGRLSSRGSGQLVYWAGSQKAERMNAGAQSSFFTFSLGDSSPRDGATHVQAGLPSSVKLFWKRTHRWSHPPQRLVS